MGDLQIPPGTLQLLILDTIARLGPQHGFGIAQFIQQTTGGALEVEEGSLYPALQRLRLKGWVDTEWRQSDHNRRARYYSLTDAGRRALAAERQVYQRTHQAILAVLRPQES